jgi:hypothetical protein
VPATRRARQDAPVTKPFVPDAFVVPTASDGPGFHLEPLGPRHNERDHEAWMSSLEHIRSSQGWEDADWPTPISPEDNLGDLESHARDFRSRVRASRAELDVPLWQALSAWLAEAWPFERPDYAPRR